MRLRVERDNGATGGVDRKSLDRLGLFARFGEGAAHRDGERIPPILWVLFGSRAGREFRF
jgi:hypothetical protein